MGGGGGILVYFAFLLFSLVPFFKVALIVHPILFPCIVKTMCIRVVFVDLCEAMLAGHNEAFWLP